MKPTIGIIHLSDIQFGLNHRFNMSETAGSEATDALLEKTVTDITELSARFDISLDLIIHSGDLAETGAPSELRRGFDFLGKISSRLQVLRIPSQSDHRFRRKPSTQSDPN